ncbi:MAG: Lrp/AsnC family transcriptional regulator [SAR202 cluster bacterium]|nr:Lrp/AsnC family transcriptional regulator [SAR202 cluster bacterium]
MAEELRRGTGGDILFRAGVRKMAANAYILVNVEPARTMHVVEQLRAIPGTVVREVLGPYDVVVELEVDTQEDITTVLRNKIRAIKGITNTVTCIWF